MKCVSFIPSLEVSTPWPFVSWILVSVWPSDGELSRLFRVTTTTLTWNGCHFRNYFAQWAVVLPLEITAAGITVQYWEKAASVPIAVWITVFWVGKLQ